MPTPRYKIWIKGDLKHSDLSYTEAIDYVMKYIHIYNEVTIESYYPTH